MVELRLVKQQHPTCKHHEEEEGKKENTINQRRDLPTYLKSRIGNLTVSLKFWLVIVMISLPVAPSPAFVFPPAPPAARRPAAAAAFPTPSNRNNTTDREKTNSEQQRMGLAALRHARCNWRRTSGAEAILVYHRGRSALHNGGSVSRCKVESGIPCAKVLCKVPTYPPTQNVFQHGPQKFSCMSHTPPPCHGQRGRERAREEARSHAGSDWMDTVLGFLV